MPTNFRRGPCRYCTKPVGRRKGRAEKSTTTGIWLVWHQRCEPGVHVVTGRETAKARRPEPPPPSHRPYYMDADDD